MSKFEFKTKITSCLLLPDSRYKADVILAVFVSMRILPRINNVRFDWVYNWSDVTFPYIVVL